MKYTEKLIQEYLWRDLIKRQHTHIVPNSLTFYPGEADLVSITKSDYINEYEIKVDRNDLKNDYKKVKFKTYEKAKQTKRYKIPNYFWYVLPIDIYKCIEKFQIIIPEYAGIMVIEKDKHIYVKRNSKLIHKDKVIQEQKNKLTNSLLYKYWNLRLK